MIMISRTAHLTLLSYLWSRLFFNKLCTWFSNLLSTGTCLCCFCRNIFFRCDLSFASRLFAFYFPPCFVLWYEAAQCDPYSNILKWEVCLHVKLRNRIWVQSLVLCMLISKGRARRSGKPCSTLQMKGERAAKWWQWHGFVRYAARRHFVTLICVTEQRVECYNRKYQEC